MSGDSKSKPQSKVLTVQPSVVDWKLLEAAGPFPRQAFAFVQEGLGYTVRQIHRDAERLPAGKRHVTGRQLCIGLRDYAIRRYGLLARSVLDHWHVQRTDDFGRIVFAMIDAGVMSRTDEDTLDDFRAVYSFEEAFDPSRIVDMIAAN